MLRAEFLQALAATGALQLNLPRPDETLGDAALLSAAILKIHEDRAYSGAVVASLSVPWGNSTDTLGGYHLVWPRDATLTAFALLAANQRLDARHILSHLIATQRPDGRWPQNYFPSGEPFWIGVQLDEVGFPVLLAAKLRRAGRTRACRALREMVRAAIGFIARNGPSSPQDRWEENPGVSPFTLAVAISALLAAAPWLDSEQLATRSIWRDEWNERLESWCYVRDTALAARARRARLLRAHRASAALGRARRAGAHCAIDEGEPILASALVSLDFSYLVRLGLRSRA